MMKARLLTIVLLLALAAHAQKTINNYRYVIVPIQFGFSKFTNQYGINTATRQLLEQKGFIAVLDADTLPPAVVANRCNALTADVQEKSTMFSTRLTLLLKDCQGNIIYQSKQGKSVEKEFYAAYNGALKDAFASLNSTPYHYDSVAAQQPVPQQVAAAPQAPPQPVASPTVQPATTAGTATLYAQPTATGYQLVDTQPKKVLTLFKTSVADYFIAQGETSNGVVFKRSGEWFFEYYEGDKLVSRKLEIKF